MNLLVMGGYGLTPDWACEVASVFINSTYSPGEKAFGIPPRRLVRIVEHVRKNLDTPLGVGTLSRLAEMSQSHFSKMFKLSTGMAPHQFVLQERINRSKELLRQDDAKIVDVALEVGFENQAHFTTVFGNLVGMTPRQFQRSSGRDTGGEFPPALEVEVAQSWEEWARNLSTGSTKCRQKLSQELKTGRRNSKEPAIEISAKWARDAETQRNGFEKCGERNSAVALESEQHDVNDSDGVGSRPGVREHDEDTGHRRDPAGEFRPPRHADGHVTHGLLSLAKASKVRPGRSHLDESRSLRAFRGACIDFVVHDSASRKSESRRSRI